MAEKLSLTLKETSAALGIGLTKLREIISSGALQSFSVGHRVLVSRVALDAFIKASEKAKKAERASG